jgi:hypothetical protein
VDFRLSGDNSFEDSEFESVLAHLVPIDQSEAGQHSIKFRGTIDRSALPTSTAYSQDLISK